MKYLIIAIAAIGIAFALFSGESKAPAQKNNPASPSKSSSSAPEVCKEGAEITGQRYNVIGSGINIRKGPGTNYDKIINQKATEILKKTKYMSIDDSTVVFEECINGEWSWIRVIEPDWLQSSHRGWVLAKFLDKGQDVGDNPYTRKIGSHALDPYDPKNYPKTVQLYGSRLKEIEHLRRRAAEMAVDSGKCDFVDDTQLSDSKSSIEHLHFWVDCRNGQRIRLDEFEIKENKAVLTQEEKSWDEKSARSACREAIKARSLIPSEVDIHTITGTSFYKAPATHNVVLTMDFDAKNAFGVEIPYTAKCYFRPGEIGEIEIEKR